MPRHFSTPRRTLTVCNQIKAFNSPTNDNYLLHPTSLNSSANRARTAHSQDAPNLATLHLKAAKRNLSLKVDHGAISKNCHFLRFYRCNLVGPSPNSALANTKFGRAVCQILPQLRAFVLAIQLDCSQRAVFDRPH